MNLDHSLAELFQFWKLTTIDFLVVTENVKPEETDQFFIEQQVRYYNYHANRETQQP